jgi:hypothetical protein
MAALLKEKASYLEIVKIHVGILEMSGETLAAISILKL